LCLIFLGALCLNKVNLLWQTKSSPAILLAIVITLIIMINAVYQDGKTTKSQAALLNYALKTACLLLFPLTGLIAYALSLRILQYGLTAPRLYAISTVVILSIYAIGYVGALFKP